MNVCDKWPEQNETGSCRTQFISPNNIIMQLIQKLNTAIKIENQRKKESQCGSNVKCENKEKRQIRIIAIIIIDRLKSNDNKSWILYAESNEECRMNRTKQSETKYQWRKNVDFDFEP